jgi:hypothetical protein
MRIFCLFIGLCALTLSTAAQTDTTTQKDTTTHKRLYSVKDTTQMAAVTVYARKPLVRNKIDGFVYDVENSVVPPTGNAADVLRRIPGLFVDQNGSLSVPGKQSVRVYIDNKPSDMYGSSVADALQQVPADEIASVEVITHPSAKYEAEGADAVVNIITKKNRFNGANGSVRAAGNDWNQNMTSTVRIRSGSVSATADLGYHHMYRDTDEELVRTGIGNSAGTNISQQGNNLRKTHSVYTGLNLVVQLDSLKALSGGYRYRIGVDDFMDKAHNIITQKNGDPSSYKRWMETDVIYQGHSVNLGYTAKTSNKKGELSVLGNWFAYDLTNDYKLDQYRLEKIDYRENSNNDGINRELALQADYSYKMKNQSVFETGVKGTARQWGSDNLVDVYDFTGNKYVPSTARSNSFKYNREIYAAYASYTITLKQWNLRLGGRYEQTRLHVHFKGSGLQVPDYKNFVPTILVTRSFDKGHTVKASYRKTILRPYLSYLDPNINYSDSLNISYGNPYLVPVITHGYQLVYSYGKGKVNTSATLYYNRNMNNIEYIRLLRPGGINETTYQNIGRMQEAGIVATVSLSGYQKFSASATINPRYFHYESKALQAVNSGYMISGNANASYRITKTWGIESMLYLSSRAFGLQGTETRYQHYNLTVSKKLLNEKLVINITADNFLTPLQTITGRMQTASFAQVEKTHYRSRYVTLIVQYKFGKKDVKITETRRIAED